MKPKYKNIRTKGYPSILEAGHAQDLRCRELAGEITHLREQVRVELVPGVWWRIDFAYKEASSEEWTFHESKGIETEDYKIKKRLFDLFCPWKCHVVKQGGHVETIGGDGQREQYWILNEASVWQRPMPKKLVE